jgi:hypothetical protein
MQSHLQTTEIQAVRCGHHDLAIDDDADGELVEKNLMQLREVPIEWPQVAALDEDIVLARTAKDDRAKAVPLWLEQKVAVHRHGVGELGEHRLYRWGDRQAGGRWHAINKPIG